ncbi:Replicative DNA helicase [Listeria grayi]|uniref:Replicative DNA helicase n=1 Tax=Listeria grayi TaxID=1641 RepID=A0A378MLZ2_LISGR|nr:Replicative DNA helicase [Listeria grayi]
MLDLNDHGKAVDILTVYETLAAEGKLEDVGGLAYLTELSSAVPTAANLEYYAHIVEDKALLRRLIRTATQIATDGYSRENELDMVMDEAEKIFWKCPNVKM